MYSSMWKPVTEAQSMPGSCASSARNASCDAPEANITLAVPRIATLALIAFAAVRAACRAMAPRSSSTRTVHASRSHARCGRHEAVAPMLGQRESHERNRHLDLDRSPRGSAATPIAERECRPAGPNTS